MATTRFKGETAGERLDYSSISDSDMLQLRHKPGTIEDEDKGISKSQLLSCPFGVSNTAAGTAAKTASLTDSNPDFILVSGREVVVCFTTANTASNPTLNFAGSGAIPIYYPNGSVVGAWDADTWMHLKYFYATVGNTSIQRWILMSPLSVDTVAANSKELITSGGVYSALNDIICYKDFSDIDCSYSAGSVGSRGNQVQFNPSISGYSIIGYKVQYIQDSTNGMIVPFFGNVDSSFYVNTYRTLSTATTNKCTIRIIYKKGSISSISDRSLSETNGGEDER